MDWPAERGDEMGWPTERGENGSTVHWWWLWTGRVLFVGFCLNRVLHKQRRRKENTRAIATPCPAQVRPWEQLYKDIYSYHRLISIFLYLTNIRQNICFVVQQPNHFSLAQTKVHYNATCRVINIRRVVLERGYSFTDVDWECSVFYHGAPIN